jgi:UDP-N-acetylmuramate: L-alanyl-gamma-D-glutamyl-meso-diaminopimelate ligase
MTADAPRPFPTLPDKIEKIHIIGICGTAMGSLAAMLKETGYEVRGSDAMAYPPMSDWLAERGIRIMLGYKEENLDWGPDLVVVGNVSRATYADAVATRERGLPYVSLPEALRHFFMRDKRNLVVTGTHGKTTTTSMLAWIFTQAGKDPSFMIGGIAGNFGSNYRLGKGDHFIIEGDEYDTAYFDKVPKFWHYAPLRATINNVEFDHADIYPDIASIEHVFRRLAQLVPAHGSVWVNGDDERVMRITQGIAATRHTFGMGAHNALRAVDVVYGEVTRARVVWGERDLGEFELPAFGEFNLRNMLGALGMALDEGVELEAAREALRTFKRTKKRQELIGVVQDIHVFDDFAHHPTAVGVTVESLRARFPGKRLWAIFEAKSNTSRRKVFQDDYPAALASADFVILSRPWKQDDDLPPEQRVDIDAMLADLRSRGPVTELIPDVDAIVEHVVARAEPGDVIVGLSGSAFGGLHKKLVAALQARFG